MNIQSYLQRFHSEMVRFNELVDKLKDVVANRLERNQSVIRALPLLEMPDAETTLPLDKFVSMQTKFATEQTVIMREKNIEVESAMRDLVRQILAYELSYVSQTVEQSDINSLSEHFAKTTYQAVLACTRTSLETLKSRVGARSLSNFLFIDAPIFEVNVEMTSSGAMMNPTLQEIQAAINACARAVLGCSRTLSVWEDDEGYASGKSVYEVISKPQGRRARRPAAHRLDRGRQAPGARVHPHLRQVRLPVAQDDKKSAYEEFMSKDPSLEDFEAELKKYDLVERRSCASPRSTTSAPSRSTPRPSRRRSARRRVPGRSSTRPTCTCRRRRSSRRSRSGSTRTSATSRVRSTTLTMSAWR